MRFSAFSLLTLAACSSNLSTQAPEHPVANVTETPSQTSDGDYLGDLAYRYLYEEADDDVTAATLAEVQGLSIADARIFLQHVKEIEPPQEYTSAQDEWVQERLRDRLLDHAETYGTSLADLSWKDVEEVEDELIAEVPEDILEVDYEGAGVFCWPGYAICSTVTFTTTLYGGSCASGCTRSSGYDRASNSSCELGVCDYRVEFPTTSMKSTVDGVTAAADCVILYYGGFIGRSSSGRTQVGYGVGGPTSCWTTGGTVSGYLQVY